MVSYNRAGFAEALQSIGVEKGDVLFTHSNIGYFGYPEEGKSPQITCEVIFNAIFDVISDTGTLVVPTFTYSFGRGQNFDVQQTSSSMGIFAEWVRQRADAVRSQDPLFSVAAVGHRAEEMTNAVSMNCFGENSFWDRFYKANGIVVNFNFDTGSTYIHYIERCLAVPYRYEKPFTGYIIDHGITRPVQAIFFCRDMANLYTDAYFEYLDEIAMRDDVVKLAKVGRGEIKGIRAQAKYTYIADTLAREPWFLTTAHTHKITPSLFHITDTQVDLPHYNHIMGQLHTFSQVERCTMSDGYDIIMNTLNLDIKTFPTGMLFNNLYIPEKWQLISASVRTTDGREVLSHSYHPLQIIPHSRSIDKQVSRVELLQHIYSHDTAIPSIEQFGVTDWALGASEEQVARLTESTYQVDIKTRFNFHMLRVGYQHKDFGSDKTIVVYTHLGLSGQANYGLSGVVVMREVMLQLKFSLFNITWVVSPIAFWGIENTLADLVILIDEVGHQGELQTILFGNTVNITAQSFMDNQTQTEESHSNFSESIPVIKVTRDVNYPERLTHLDTFTLIREDYLQATIRWLLRKFQGTQID